MTGRFFVGMAKTIAGNRGAGSLEWRALRTLLAIALLAAAACGKPPKKSGQNACDGATPPANDASRHLVSGGLTRVYRVHYPPSYDDHHPTPLVLDFHGLTMDKDGEAWLSHTPQKADSAGFIDVLADGVGNSWNAGDGCCDPAEQQGVNDVQFVSDLLDELERDYCVDARRVYVTGFSNGGFLANRLACDLSGRIAAIAPVAGVNPRTNAECKPSRPVPVLHFHGDADPIVPYAGGGGFVGAQQSVDDWAARDGCDATAATTFQKGDATCVTRTRCSGGAEVTLCTIANGGHTWPGGSPMPVLGNTSTDLSATDAMWTFFAAHPLP